MQATAPAGAPQATSLAAELRPLVTVLFGSAMTGFAGVALSVLIGVRLAASQGSATVVGIAAACHFAGLMVGCQYAPRFIVAVGHVRAYAIFTALCTFLTLALVLFEYVWVWGLLRLGIGFCLAACFTVVESWLNQQVGAKFRGRVFAIYMIISSGAGGLAPLTITVIDPFGLQLFVVIAMGFALAPLGMMVRVPRIPVVEGRARMRLAALFAISPGGVIACFAHGLVNSAFHQVSPVYFQRLHLSPDLLSVYLSAATFAGVAMQAPIGALSDRFARHYILLTVALLAVAMAVPLSLLTAPTFVIVVISGVALAACINPFYSLGVGIANDRLAGHDFVGAAGILLFVWATGASIGPIVSSALIDAIGPTGLFIYIGATALVIAGITLHRIVMRPLPVPTPPPKVPTRS